jgi:hypothetical protein
MELFLFASLHKYPIIFSFINQIEGICLARLFLKRFMKTKFCSLFMAIIISSTLVSTASGQAMHDSTSKANSAMSRSDSSTHINYNYFGWLGLFGLFGLRRRKSANAGIVRSFNP